MGIKSYIPSAFLPANSPPYNTDGSDAAYSYYQWKRPGTSLFSASPRNSMDSQVSIDSHESYTSGRFDGKGVFGPARNAQYNFLVQKFRHRKEYKQETKEETEMKSISGFQRSRRRASSGASRRNVSDVDGFKVVGYD